MFWIIFRLYRLMLLLTVMFLFPLTCALRSLRPVSLQQVSVNVYTRGSSACFSTSVLCKTESDIEALGRKLAAVCDIGDTLLMRGDLGAGKTTLARGLIRAKLEDEEMLITSPSYLLDNVYEYGPDQRIHHMDLYRLPSGCDMSMLGIPDIFTSCLCLVEWPQRMGDRTSNNYPQDFLDVNLNILEDESRKIELLPSTDSSSWNAKLKEIA